MAALALLLLAAALLGASADAQSDPALQAFDLVPEMVTPPGIAVAPPSRRADLPSGPDIDEVLRQFQARVDSMWPAIRDVDLVALSRFQVKEMDTYKLPQSFDDWRGKVLGVSDDGRLFLELRGPRLPARYDIVFRYLTVFSSFDPSSGAIGRPVVTIRGWIEE